MLEVLTLKQALQTGAAIREDSRRAQSLEEVAVCVVRHLYETLIDPVSGERACALVRLFKTHDLEDLPADLQRRVRQRETGERLSPRTRCLVLLATAGEIPAWNDRRQSRDHQVIPLASEEMIARSPMISQLLAQFGVETRAVVSPADDLILEPGQQVYNVFHIPQAQGSPHIPAQDEFVIPYGIRSVVGFGGPLIGGNLFAAVLFLKTWTRRATAELFKSVALNTELALLPLAGEAIFAR